MNARFLVEVDLLSDAAERLRVVGTHLQREDIIAAALVVGAIVILLRDDGTTDTQALRDVALRVAAIEARRT